MPGLKAELAIAFKAFECVLSEGPAHGTGVVGCLGVWAVDGFCAWRGLRVRAFCCMHGMSKRRASGGCLGARRR